MKEPGLRQPSGPPLVSIKGDATEEEVAALVAAVHALETAARSVTEPAAPPSTWAAPARRVRTSHDAGPGRWRASALPR